MTIISSITRIMGIS